MNSSVRKRYCCTHIPAVHICNLVFRIFIANFTMIMKYSYAHTHIIRTQSISTIIIIIIVFEVTITNIIRISIMYLCLRAHTHLRILRTHRLLYIHYVLLLYYTLLLLLHYYYYYHTLLCILCVVLSSVLLLVHYYYAYAQCCKIHSYNPYIFYYSIYVGAMRFLQSSCPVRVVHECVWVCVCNVCFYLFVCLLG